jgi:hypothetical protein
VRDEATYTTNQNPLQFSLEYPLIAFIEPSESYRALEVELKTALIFTKDKQERNRKTTTLINAILTSLLTKSRRICVIIGILIDKHFTLMLSLFNDSQVDTLEG